MVAEDENTDEIVSTHTSKIYLINNNNTYGVNGV